MSRPSSKILVVGTALVCAGAFVPVAAQAAFPGTNARIAFDSARSGAINIFTVDPASATPGATVQQVTTSANVDEVPSGSPDGLRLVFRSDRNNSVGQIFTVLSNGNLDQTLLPPDGATQLTTITAGDDKDASWYPDNASVIFSRKAAGVGATYQLQRLQIANPSAVTPVLATPSGCDDTNPQVDPVNASLVAFIRSCAAAAKQLMLVDTSAALGASNPKNLTAISNAIAAQPYVVNSDEEPDWAPDGSKLVVAGTGPSTLFGGFSQVYSINPDGTGRSPFWGPAGTGTNDRSPTYSPDATKIAFTRNVPGTGADIWTTEVSALNSLTSAQAPKDVTPARGPDLHPTWLLTSVAGPVVPEAPFAVLLPLTGLLAIGAVVFLRRRAATNLG